MLHTYDLLFHAMHMPYTVTIVVAVLLLTWPAAANWADLAALRESNDHNFLRVFVSVSRGMMLCQ